MFKGLLWAIFCVDLNTHGNEKLCKIYLKNFFFRNVLAFSFYVDVFVSLISSTQIACDVMCVQYV